MSEKKANVHWEGGGRNGKGQISTETDALKAYPYGFASRFEDDRAARIPKSCSARRMRRASRWPSRSPVTRPAS
jgi:hypothetical protein